MKTFKFILVVFAAMGMAISCSDDKGFFDKDAIVYAAYLNVVSTGSSTWGTVSQSDFRVNTSSFYEVTLEERDVERGKLFQSVDFYVKLRDNTTPKASTDEKPVKSIPASEFVQDPETDYPRATIKITAAEVLSALGLTQDAINGGDQVEVRYELVMKDGRIFTNSNASGIVTGGAFFNSPFFYRIPVVCASDRAGDYDVVTFISEYDGTYPAFQTSGSTTIAKGSGAGQYTLCDLSGGLEPEIWGNGAVFVTVQDLCGKLSLVGADRDENFDCKGDGKGYYYPYYIDASKSFINLSNGSFTIYWSNEYGENGYSIYTPN